MDKSERNFVFFAVIFVTFGLANAWYLHWLPYSAPPVMLVLGLGLYSIWEVKRGNKA